MSPSLVYPSIVVVIIGYPGDYMCTYMKYIDKSLSNIHEVFEGIWEIDNYITSGDAVSGDQFSTCEFLTQ